MSALRVPPPLSTQELRYSPTGVDRIIPIRFIHLRPSSDGLFNNCNSWDSEKTSLVENCGAEESRRNAEAAIDWANVGFRPAGIQFVLKANESYGAPTLHKTYYRGTTLYTWPSVKGELKPLFSIPDNGCAAMDTHDVVGWLSQASSEYGKSDEIAVYVEGYCEKDNVNAACGGRASYPWSSRYIALWGPSIVDHGSLAHELGHWFGLMHTQIAAQAFNPVTLAPYARSDFWDLVFCPGAGGTATTFSSRAAAASFSCPGGLRHIDRGGEDADEHEDVNIANWNNCSMESSGRLTCELKVAAGDPAGPTKTSDDPELKGLGFAASNVAGAPPNSYGVNLLTYHGAPGGNRISDSQAEAVRRVMRYEQPTAYGTPSRRVTLGYGSGRQPQVTLDFDHDGRRDLAVWIPPYGASTSGTFKVRLSSMNFDSGFVVYPRGVHGVVPVPADYNGDGYTDLGWFGAPSNNNFTYGDGGATDQAYWEWCLTNANAPASTNCSSTTSVAWGQRYDIPLPGFDFNGDGDHDLLVMRPATGRWAWYHTNVGTTGYRDLGAQWGHTPLPGYYDADNLADIGWYAPEYGAFGLSLSSSGWPSSSFLSRSVGANCVVSTTGLQGNRAGCTAVPAVFSVVSNSAKTTFSAVDNATDTWYVFNNPVASSAYSTCGMFVDGGQGRSKPLGLLGFNQSFSPLAASTLSTLKLGDSGASQATLFTRSLGCGAITQTNLGAIPHSHSVYSVLDMTGDGYPDIVEYDQDGHLFYIRSSSAGFAVVKTVSFGDSYAVVL